MSSSSSVTRPARAAAVRPRARLGPVARLLKEALAALATDVPACYDAARDASAGKRARCRIDGEAFVATFSRRDIDVATSVHDVDMDVALSRRTILALVRNERSLHAAVLSGDLRIRGAMEDVAGLGRSMKAFLNGAVRSPALPEIFARFERLVESTGGRRADG